MLPVHDTTGIPAALVGSTSFADASRLLSATSADGTVTYRYDPTGQLIGAEYSGTQEDEQYWYDANGNRTGATVGTSSTAYVIGVGNHLLSEGRYWYEYDANGNRSERYVWTDADADGQVDAGEKSQITRYTWDGRNRLVRVAEYETEEGPAAKVVTYYYDVENRWIGQTIDRDGDGTVDHTRWFGYDGQQMLVQFDREGGGRLTAQDQSHRYLWGPAVDQILADEQLFPLATEEGTSASFPLPPGEGQGEGAAHGGGYDLRTPGRVLWPLADHLGTVRDLAQYGAASGMTTVVKHRQYDSYGNLVSAIDPATNQPAAVDFLFGFTGRPFDKTTGLQNNLNRWYDPAVGRWLSPDPLGFSAGDANLYRYVGNGPTSFADSSGLAKKRFWRIWVHLEKDTAEFVLENGQRIKIRNSKFIDSTVTLAMLEKITNVSPETIKRLRQRYGEITVTFNKFGQPDFSQFRIARVRVANPGAADYRDAAWEALRRSNPKAYELYYPKREQYVWHHAADGSLELIDKDLHEAFQHTGLNSMLRKSLSVAGLLVPGLDQFRQGKLNEGFREVALEFTPLSWSVFFAELLGDFVDECLYEIYGDNPYER